MSNLLCTFTLDYYEIFNRADVAKTCSYDREREREMYFNFSSLSYQIDFVINLHKQVKIIRV